MEPNPAYRLIDAEEFLDIDFGPDRKAELDAGVIRMMAGGTGGHSRVQGNVFAYLRAHLRGSGCRPHGSDMAVKTDRWSVRYPDVSIICGDQTRREDDKKKSYENVVAVFEILSPSTSVYDQNIKLKEYQLVTAIQTIVFIDPDAETVRTVQRLGPGSWRDDSYPGPADVAIPSLEVIIPAAEIFARD
jgi:Uma2 family endonuclease